MRGRQRVTFLKQGNPPRHESPVLIKNDFKMALNLEIRMRNLQIVTWDGHSYHTTTFRKT